MGLPRTYSEIDGDLDGYFSRKSQNFPSPCTFRPPPMKRFPSELGTGARNKTLVWWGYRAVKEVWRYLQPSQYSAPTWQTDRRTDRQTPSDSKDLAGNTQRTAPILSMLKYSTSVSQQHKYKMYSKWIV